MSKTRCQEVEWPPASGKGWLLTHKTRFFPLFCFIFCWLLKSKNRSFSLKLVVLPWIYSCLVPPPHLAPFPQILISLVSSHTNQIDRYKAIERVTSRMGGKYNSLHKQDKPAVLLKKSWLTLGLLWGPDAEHVNCFKLLLRVHWWWGGEQPTSIYIYTFTRKCVYIVFQSGFTTSQEFHT